MVVRHQVGTQNAGDADALPFHEGLREFDHVATLKVMGLHRQGAQLQHTRAHSICGSRTVEIGDAHFTIQFVLSRLESEIVRFAFIQKRNGGTRIYNEVSRLAVEFRGDEGYTSVCSKRYVMVFIFVQWANRRTREPQDERDP